jgi:hypothetical protein
MVNHSYDPATGQRQSSQIRPSFTEATYVPSTPQPEPYFGRGPSAILADPAATADPISSGAPFLSTKQDLEAGEVGKGSSGLLLPSDD